MEAAGLASRRDSCLRRHGDDGGIEVDARQTLSSAVELEVATERDSLFLVAYRMGVLP
jgi:hypothetical protein